MSRNPVVRRSASAAAAAALAMVCLSALGTGRALAVSAEPPAPTAAQPSETAQTFSITVKSLGLSGAMSFVVGGLTEDTKVGELRMVVAKELQAAPQDVVLIYRFQELQDVRTLGYYKIGSGSVVDADVL